MKQVRAQGDKANLPRSQSKLEVKAEVEISPFQAVTFPLGILDIFLNSSMRIFP